MPGALSSIDDWDERAAAEQAAVGLVELAWPTPDERVAVLRCFSTEVAYLCYRLLARRRGTLLAPLQYATRIAASRDEAIRWRLGAVHGTDIGAIRGLATDAAQRIDTAGVVDLLVRVAAARTAGGWGDPDLLREWIARAPETFRPILLGRRWSEVPRGLRRELLWAAAPTFGTALLGRDSEVPSQFGVAAVAAVLLSDPARVAAVDAVDIVLVLGEVLEPAQVLGTLYRLASHPEPDVRAAVAEATIRHRWRHECDERDLVAVVGAVTADAAGAAAAWRLADSWMYEPEELPPPVLDALVAAAAEHLSAGREPPGQSAGITEILSHLMTVDPTRAWAALGGVDRARGWWTYAREIAVGTEHVPAALAAVDPDTLDSLGLSARVFDGLVAQLDPAQLRALIEPRVDSALARKLVSAAGVRDHLDLAAVVLHAAPDDRWRLRYMADYDDQVHRTRAWSDD